MCSGGGWRAYRRVGEVTATQLTSTRTWRTSQGDMLTSQPGDWWVVDDLGVGRGVAAARFEELYVPAYYKAGSVMARRIAEPAYINTLEGQVLASVGDWLVCDGTSMWPVPDAVFRLSYRRTSTR